MPALPTADPLVPLLDAIYTASLDPTLLPAMLEAARAALQVAAISFAPPPFVGGAWFTAGIPPEVIDRYLVEHASIDPWIDAIHARLERGEDRLLCPSTVFCPRDRFHRSVLFNELFGPAGIGDGGGAMIPGRDGFPLTFNFLHPAGSGPTEPWQLELVARLVPHLSRMARIHSLVGEAALGALTHTTLDALALAVLIVDARGVSLWHNTSARGLLQSPSPGLRLTPYGLSAATPAASSALHRALAAARSGTGSTVVLPRSASLRPWVAALVPLAAPLAERHGLAGASVALFLRDAGEPRVPSVTLLRELYGLTPAEARLALLIGRGDAPKDAANTLAVAWNTVRAQLVSIFAKTGTTRQPELVQLLSALGPVVRSDL